MLLKTTKWIWQESDYPNFFYDKSKLESLLLDIKYHQGLIDGIYSQINPKDILKSQLEVLTLDALDTSAIEDEILSRNSVRSSISKKLGLDISTTDQSTPMSDGLIDILLDATNNYQDTFTIERLFGWHNALFPSGYSGLTKINVASFRGTESMQIVSGAVGREKVHYIAPPREVLDKEMTVFLEWLNSGHDLSIIKAGIAHLWFVILHPFDDGNGRVARALSDMVLAKEANQPLKLYSISSAIKNSRKKYYEILEITTTGSMDITLWLEWFLKILLEAIKNSKSIVDDILQKTLFWDRNRDIVLNSRQMKVLNKLLDIGNDNFEGGINTRKYASLTKVSKPTASRELRDLVNKGCLKQREGTSGRNVSYKLHLN